ncbi:LysE family translocator [Vibrio coralliilyticus]|uniref:LysE family translocator n=1 Tax=Vibrio coralliilyticus TaxID=190893 RepID=UPI00155FDF2D|nr:LysE family translocator [Vibrio coralliilyticus]NRF23772.1 LysE family translocator [Vibrio coralliilyticus]NRF77517.1 LysE family translocator [Vibrio coralliilyticus]
MDIDVWFTYVVTVLVLMSTPGPSQLLMLSNSMGSGFRRSIYTAIGDLTANFFQMVIAALGLTTVIANSQHFFTAVKWGGVAYLFYLGMKLLLSNPSNTIEQQGQQRSKSSLYWQGFITSAANPKAVVFFAALFPQFINPESGLLMQFVVLSSTYLIMDCVFLCFYGKFAESIAHRLYGNMKHQLDRVSGIFLMVAAVLLGNKEVS